MLLFLIGEQCRQVFSNREFFSGIRYYLSQYHGLIAKTFLVHYRRWALTLIVFLLPIVYNLLSNLISRSRNESGIFKMNINSLNPQTILYKTDPIMDKFFRASIDGAILEQGSGNLSQMNEHIWRKIFHIIQRTNFSIFVILEKRKDRLYTYTDVYLAFNIPQPLDDMYKIQALSSNLISGHEVINLASNTIYKYALNDTSASIQTTLIYKNTGNFSGQPTIGDVLNYLSQASCFLKFLPTSILLDV
jgi:hypothetical protein